MKSRTRNEVAALVAVAAVGVAARLAVIAQFPTIPFSDFARLTAFAVHLREHGIASYTPHWDYFNPGLPLALSLVMRVFSGVPPADVARTTTAVMCGLLGLIPLLAWRGVLPLWTRALAGAALAVWPGQVFFSGTVAQDTWLLPPSIALGALAVRAMLSDERPRLVLAALLYGAAVAVRQEMSVVLLPALLATMRVSFRMGRRRALAAAMAWVLPLVAIAAWRGAATGRFALSSQHGGLATLGSYIPGATVNAWADPYPYIASVRPELLWNRKELYSQAGSLAVHEALRRPGFQAARIVTSTMACARGGEAGSLYWCLGAAEALPEALRARGQALADALGFPLCYEQAAIHALFVAALIIGIRRRSVPVLVLSSVVLLKYALHAVTVPQPRYFFVATAFEILTIAVAAFQFRKMGWARERRFAAGALTAGTTLALIVLLLTPRLSALVQSWDTDFQRTYKFLLESPDGSATLSCTMNEGLLVALDPPRPADAPAGQFDHPRRATLRTMKRDPAPGEAATAVCGLTGTGTPRPATLQVLDPYAPGGFPDRLVQRVEVDGVEVFRHDIAAQAGSGWADVPLGEVGAGTNKKVVIEVKAVRPDPGPGWGEAARTTVQLLR